MFQNAFFIPSASLNVEIALVSQTFPPPQTDLSAICFRFSSNLICCLFICQLVLTFNTPHSIIDDAFHSFSSRFFDVNVSEAAKKGAPFKLSSFFMKIVCKKASRCFMWKQSREKEISPFHMALNFSSSQEDRKRRILVTDSRNRL
jgi:hypothetical protein